MQLCSQQTSVSLTQLLQRMQTGELHITLEIEGRPEDSGHVRLSYLLERLEVLQQSLNAINTSLTCQGRTLLHYRVVNASHNSPFRVVIEPHANENTDVDAKVEETHHRFFGELARFARREHPSADLSPDAVEKMAELIQWDKKRFSRMLIHNQSATVELGDEIRSAAQRYLADEEFSLGQIEGLLEAINLHGTRKSFYIYPTSGPTRVKCDFQPRMKDRVRDALDHRVRITGRKHYRRNQMFPHMIEVRDLEVLNVSDIPHLVKFAGVLPADLDTDAEIRRMRDEW